jgi:hypothetical protein
LVAFPALAQLPNIVIIMADDMGYSDIANDTPSLQAMAANVCGSLISIPHRFAPPREPHNAALCPTNRVRYTLAFSLHDRTERS